MYHVALKRALRNRTLKFSQVLNEDPLTRRLWSGRNDPFSITSPFSLNVIPLQTAEIYIFITLYANTVSVATFTTYIVSTEMLM